MRKRADIMSKTGKWLLVFGFIFSEISFPLEVLADEVLATTTSEQEVLTTNTEDSEPVTTNDIEITEEQPVNDEPIITINGQETTDYTINGIENTEVTVALEYQGQSETETFDFSKELYGIYQYTFETVAKTVTIRYEGNNADLLKPYENVTGLTKKIICDTEECIISGFGTNLLTVGDITTNYYNLEAFKNYYKTDLVITNEETLSDTDNVMNGYKLVISDNDTDSKLVNTTPISSYTITRVGDIIVDGIIDTKDQEAILTDIIKGNEVTNMNDINEDSELNILDVTSSLFINNIVEGEDILTNTLTATNEEILINEEVEVKLFISGFDKLSLYGIEGLLTYDENILELVSAQVNEETKNLGYLNLDNNKFAYILNGFNNTESAVLTLKFKALSVGSSEITISNIIESYGETFEVENNTATTTVTVLDYGKGGDVEEETTNSTPETTETKNETTTTTKTATIKNAVKFVSLSSDYYIKELTIEGYEINFDMYTYEYSIKVKNDVTSLNINVLLNDNNAIYYIEGNENFQVGENTVNIVVKAENGSTKTYTIKVEREKETTKKATEVKEEETEEKSASKTIIIILIILVIIGLIYVIFKDDEEDAKEIQKNTKSEKTKEAKKNNKK